MTKRLALLQKLAQRSMARIPQSTKYGNLRFIKNLGGLPTVENGLTWLSPKTQYFANLTTDIPFRLHHNYHHIPGGEYMIINPDALRGIKPYTIDPMDTILKNSEALIDPKHITILSGNPGLLRRAKQQGFNIAITPELHAGYQRVLGEINTPTDPLDRRLHKTLSFGKSRYAEQYRSAVDDFFTQLGRPTHQNYLQLERATGLPSHTISFNQMQANFNSGKAGVTWDNMSKPAFIYPDGREIIGTKILTRDLDDFYKNVGYNPTPTTEVDLLNQMGGFSKPHPTIFDIYPDTEKVFEQWRMLNVPGSLKNGGRIAKYQGAGWIGKGIEWLFTKGDDIAKYTSGVKKRAAEAVIRTGDAAESIYGLSRQMTSPKTIKYVFNPKRSELAYQLPYRYSGLTASARDARPGDVVDIFLGKTIVPNDIAFKDLPLEIQSYLSKNYPGRKIITRRLGNTSKIIPSITSKDYGQASLLPGQSKKLIGDFNHSAIMINGRSVLDPGGYNIYATRLGDDLILDAYDVWKFKPADYSKQYGTNIRGIGLNFIDSQGNPIVSAWQSRIPNYFSQELKLKPFEPYIPTLKDKLQKYWDRYFNPIVGIGTTGGLIYGAKKAIEQIE